MLRDSVERDYSGKLVRFDAFAAGELRQVIGDLDIPRDARVLDLGCGAGGALRLLDGPGRLVYGVDLSWPHAVQAAQIAPDARVVVGDIRHLPFRDVGFDLLWACNSLNHVTASAAALRDIGKLLKPEGRVAVVQSHVLPEMFFAWDYHFDARVRAACHAYYRSKYGLSEQDTAGVPGVVGLVRQAGFTDVRPRTYVVERWAPLSELDRTYLTELFASAWGERLAPFLGRLDMERLRLLCDPHSPDFCLDRPDYHHIQTMTVVIGRPQR